MAGLTFSLPFHHLLYSYGKFYEYFFLYFLKNLIAKAYYEYKLLFQRVVDMEIGN